MAKSDMKKAIIFDSGTLISLSMNGLLDVIKNLKKDFKGNFFVTEDVKKELVDYPIQRKQFELEALRIRGLIEENVLELPDKAGLDNKSIKNKAEEIMNMTNNIFVSHKKPLKIIHDGESSCLALSKLLFDRGIENVIAIDERTTRMLIEKPENLKELFEKKLHTKIDLKKNSFPYFKDFRVIRSSEIVYVAWKKKLIDIKDGTLVLDALLYAVKFKGCAISSDEIEEIKKIR
jgi:hypothetical protein